MRTIEGLRGAAIVTRPGSAALEFADGLADAETGARCTPSTRFQISSLSKQFAGAAVMLLAESGKLALGEGIGQWFPGCPARWHNASLHQLLTHTAGVRHWEDRPGLRPSEPMALDERLALILGAPPLGEPGAQWRYSSPGYLLAGRIVELASGRAYPDFVSERILRPLGMTATTAGVPVSAPDVARGHREGAPVDPWDLSAMPGTGDICSTVADLARFTTALHTGSLLSPRSLEAMRAPHTADGAQLPGASWLTAEGYGYGLYAGAADGEPVYFHTGDNPGYQSLSAWLPSQQRCVVILANEQACDTESVLRQLLAAADDPSRGRLGVYAREQGAD